jgi:hypothetical protein
MPEAPFEVKAEANSKHQFVNISLTPPKTRRDRDGVMHTAIVLLLGLAACLIVAAIHRFVSLRRFDDLTEQQPYPRLDNFTQLWPLF